MLRGMAVPSFRGALRPQSGAGLSIVSGGRGHLLVRTPLPLPTSMKLIRDETSLSELSRFVGAHRLSVPVVVEANPDRSFTAGASALPWRAIRPPRLRRKQHGSSPDFDASALCTAALPRPTGYIGSNQMSTSLPELVLHRRVSPLRVAESGATRNAASQPDLCPAGYRPDGPCGRNTESAANAVELRLHYPDSCRSVRPAARKQVGTLSRRTGVRYTGARRPARPAAQPGNLKLSKRCLSRSKI